MTPQSPRQPHVVLLGDSIFDNGAYTGGAPDVLTHLRRLLPPNWRATLLAVDGATIAALPWQLDRVPADASHLVISIGGNDALQNSDLLSLGVRSMPRALEVLAERVSTFEHAYRTSMRKAAALRRATAVCTIYNGAFDEPQATAVRVGVAIFNDAILRVAIAMRFDVIELRMICNEPADYANPIEPSGPGGLKIARALGHAVGARSERPPPIRVWAPT